MLPAKIILSVAMFLVAVFLWKQFQYQRPHLPSFVHANPDKEVPEIWRNTLTAAGFIPASDRPWVLFMNDYHDWQELRKLSRWDPKWVYGLNGVNMLANKGILPMILETNLGESRAAGLIPRSISVKTRFANKSATATDDGPWICKKNLQRQRDIKILPSYKDVETLLARDDTYSVCQVLLRDPYVIAGHKINLRVYVILTFRAGKATWHVYDNGFLYYAPKQFDASSLDLDVHVTTGYVDRAIYETNPLTLHDLAAHMGEKNFGALWNSVRGLVADLQEAYAPVLSKTDGGDGVAKMLVLGLDVAPCRDLSVRLMEINKGPDLGAKDERDGEVKRGLVRYAVSLISGL